VKSMSSSLTRDSTAEISGLNLRHARCEEVACWADLAWKDQATWTACLRRFVYLCLNLRGLPDNRMNRSIRTLVAKGSDNLTRFVRHANTAPYSRDAVAPQKLRTCRKTGRLRFEAPFC
jgi:hypothetical protein